MNSGRKTAYRQRSFGFTLVELLVVISVIAILVAIALPVYGKVLARSRATASSSNLHQLAIANLGYAADHDGSYCPAQDTKNLVRWHGARTSGSGAFDPSKGFLAPYLGLEKKVVTCPLFAEMVKGSASFENGTGGYGYNATYIGGTPDSFYQPTQVSRVPRPTQTVMFASTAFAVSSGLQEYPYCEPREWVDPNYQLSGELQPSVHFRANGRAVVAWCDGHVTLETPSKIGGSDYYEGDSKAAKIGWFGPSENNGYWNPAYPDLR